MKAVLMRVRSRSIAADGVAHLVLERADGAEVEAWEPGAHVDLRLGDDLVRQYSLCGDPSDRSRWEVAVLKVDDGQGGSVQVHERLGEGAEVEVVGPRNKFPLRDAGSYLFIAGGIGITPLLPMIRAVAARGVPWRLAYGGRTRRSMAFADDLVEEFGDRVAVLPAEEHGLLDLAGILDAPAPGRRVYCCGPEPLLQAVEAAMVGRVGEELHVERFAAKDQGPAASGSFEVRAQASGVDVTVAGDESIIDALQRAGVAVDFSCREGTCGTCEVAVLGGTPEHRDSVLSADEQARNECMMICVGRCIEGPLVLDL